MKPLNLKVIRESYRKVLDISGDTVEELAKLTMGYAYAYQAFGYYMWEQQEKKITDLMLAKVDAVLAERVYGKIWSELSPKDKWYLSFIVKKESMEVAELLSETKSSHAQWSMPRKRLIEKGIIGGENRGKIELRLPRFSEFVKDQEMG